jgi:hypothetical protein
MISPPPTFREPLRLLFASVFESRTTESDNCRKLTNSMLGNPLTLSGRREASQGIRKD